MENKCLSLVYSSSACAEFIFFASNTLNYVANIVRERRAVLHQSDPIRLFWIPFEIPT